MPPSRSLREYEGDSKWVYMAEEHMKVQVILRPSLIQLSSTIKIFSLLVCSGLLKTFRFYIDF